MPQPLEYPFPTPPSEGAALEVVPGLFWLRFAMPFALDHINLWLLREGDGWTQVDAGLKGEATQATWARHFAGAMQGRPLKRLIVTHYHPDHIGSAAWLAERFGIEVEMSYTEWVSAQAIWHRIAAYSEPVFSDFLRSHGLTPEFVQKLMGRVANYALAVPELPKRCRRIKPGETVRFGERDWRVFAGHGHTPEHLSFYNAEANVLIAGDMLLPKISTHVTVGSSDPEADSVGDFLRSIAAYKTLPEDVLVLPSHGLPFRGAHARVDALTHHHAERMNALAAGLVEPRSAAEAMPLLFGRTLDTMQSFFALGESIGHLNHGWKGGRFERLRDIDGVWRYRHIAG